MYKEIIVSLQIEGLHCWKDCNIDEVMFLSNLHRHMFYITCKKKVSENNREIEFVMLKRSILQYLFDKYGNVADFNSMSCEDIAEELLVKFKLNYCSVLEDNECGASVSKGE